MHLNNSIASPEKMALPAALPECRPVSPASARRRLEWVDYAKGICIICVVFGHTVGGMMDWQLLPRAGVHDLATQVMYAFRMPTLFFLSGLFLFRSVQKKASTFILDRAAVLIYPCVFWSIIQSGLRVAAYQSPDGVAKFRDVLLALPWQPFGELWFLYVLFLIAVILLVLHKASVPPAVMLAAAVGMYVIWGLTSVMEPIAHGLRLDWMLPRLGLLWLTCKFSVYVALGYFLSARFSPDLAKLPRRVWPAIFFPFLAALCVLTYLAVTGRPYLSHASALAGPLLALLGGGAVIALSKWLAEVHWLAFLRLIGSKSLQVYLAHPLITGGLRTLLNRFGYVHRPKLLILPLWIGGVLFPLGLDWVVRKTGAFWIFSLRRDRAIASDRNVPVRTVTPPVTETAAVHPVLFHSA
jgi:fucose 4-O-acetylase-like acetyltransferase